MAVRPVRRALQEIDVVDGLTINPDGDWTFDPGDGAYDYLSAGDTQEIDVQYQVEDEDGATATNRFSIYAEWHE